VVEKCKEWRKVPSIWPGQGRPSVSAVKEPVQEVVVVLLGGGVLLLGLLLGLVLVVEEAADDPGLLLAVLVLGRVVGLPLVPVVTSMLTLIAYRFAVGADVPKVPYLTLLDTFILASSLLVFLSLVEVVITTSLAVAGRIEAARAIDRHSRWIFPSAFSIVTAAILLR